MTTTRHPGADAPTVSQISLPEDARALSTLPRIDYEDGFCVAADGERTPRDWIGVVLGDAPPRVRRRLWLGWTALGVKLGPPWSSRRVLGWKVIHDDRAYTLLGADSWLGFRGQLLFRREPDGLLFATFVQQTNPATRALWAAITPRHQAVVRSLLAHGARRASSPRAPSDAPPGAAPATGTG